MPCLRYMFALVAITGIMLLQTPTLSASIVAQRMCGAYTIQLKSHSQYFDDFMTLEKVSKSGKWDGLWRMTDYRQVMRFMGPVPISKTETHTHQLGHGMWMKTKVRITSKRATTRMVEGKVLFEIKNGKIGYSKTKVWLGEITPEGKATIRWPGVPNAAANPLHGHGSLSGSETVKIEIKSPAANKRYVFDGAKPGKFIVDVTAQVTPPTYNNKLEWHAEKIPGTDIAVSGTGPNVRITYTNPPAENDHFGPHTIVAKLNVDECALEATLPIRIFFPRDEKNNPEGKYPNWFYYWKQTKAAKPDGQTINILYGGSEFHECANLVTPALFRPGYAYKSIHVCNLSKLGNAFTNKMPLLTHPSAPQMQGWQTTKGIDTYATVVLHEYMHWKAYHNWRKGKSKGQIKLTDKDDDGIPDDHEYDIKFDPQKKQTYMANDPKLRNIGYDEEWLCFEEMRKHQLGQYDSVDWSYPGKQWGL